MTTIELVRHAKALSRDRWWGKPDRDRFLTEAGYDQSRALVRALRADGDIEALYSSPFVRCVQTLEPLAEELGLDVIDAEELAEATTLPVLDAGNAWVGSAWLGGRALSWVDGAVARHDGGRVVGCSHGDVIPAVVALLAGRDGLELSDVRCRKGGRFTLQFEAGRCVAATLLPPPDD